MVAVDTSSLVEFLQGANGSDVDMVTLGLQERNLILPPIVLAEVLSDPKLSKTIRNNLEQIPSLPILDGFWIRAGLLRAKVFEKKQKARFGDALIAQFCIDHNIVLITRDRDFKAFEKFGKLKVVIN